MARTPPGAVSTACPLTLTFTNSPIPTPTSLLYTFSIQQCVGEGAREDSISIFGITMGLFSGLRPRSGLSRTTFLRDLGVAALIMLAVLGATTVIDSLWPPITAQKIRYGAADLFHGDDTEQHSTTAIHQLASAHKAPSRRSHDPYRTKQITTPITATKLW